MSVKLISEIDNLYMSSITDPMLAQIKKAQGDKSWTPVVVYPQVLWKDRMFSNKVKYALLKVVIVLYKSFYFYFFPFLMILANYMSVRCDRLPVISVKQSIASDFTPVYLPQCKHEPSIFLVNLFNNSLL